MLWGPAPGAREPGQPAASPTAPETRRRQAGAYSSSPLGEMILANPHPAHHISQPSATTSDTQTHRHTDTDTHRHRTEHSERLVVSGPAACVAYGHLDAATLA